MSAEPGEDQSEIERRTPRLPPLRSGTHWSTLRALVLDQASKRLPLVIGGLCHLKPTDGLAFTAVVLLASPLLRSDRSMPAA